MEEAILMWERIPKISSAVVLCSVNPTECLSERQMMEGSPISTAIMGSKPITKLIQVFQPIMASKLHVSSLEMEMGIL